MKPEHLFRAMRQCCNGVRWKASVQHFEVDTLRWAASIRRDVMAGTYKSKGFMRFDIVERGKPRHIQAVHISERVVQKLLCNYALKPEILPRLIYDNSASQEGKGTEFALKRLKEHLRWHYARYGRKGAVLIMDYKDYFGSIPHNAAIRALCMGQSDERITGYVSDFVNAFDGDSGLGLGSETSQVAAICFPNPLDRFIKERLRIHCYGRYMDDSYLIHPDRRYLERCLEEIKRVAAENGIQINDAKTRIHNLETDVFVFLKKRVHLSGTGKVVMRISRENFNAERRRLLYMREEMEAGRMPEKSMRQSYTSWRGYARKCNSYRAVGKMNGIFKRTMGGKRETGDCD